MLAILCYLTREVTVIKEALADMVIRSCRIPLRSMNFYLRGVLVVGPPGVSGRGHWLRLFFP